MHKVCRLSLAIWIATSRAASFLPTPHNPWPLVTECERVRQRPREICKQSTTFPSSALGACVCVFVRCCVCTFYAHILFTNSFCACVHARAHERRRGRGRRARENRLTKVVHVSFNANICRRTLAGVFVIKPICIKYIQYGGCRWRAGGRAVGR